MHGIINGVSCKSTTDNPMIPVSCNEGKERIDGKKDLVVAHLAFAFAVEAKSIS